jgi:hypothetical protein
VRATVERCARVAENISTITGYPHYQHTADAIAAAIRLSKLEKGSK